MNRFLKYSLFSLFIVIFTESLGQEFLSKTRLVNENGLGRFIMVFEPGIYLENEKVRKTFQPSFVVTSNGTVIAFCQGRLKFGNDNDPKVILMNKSFDNGLTWEGVKVLSNPMNFFAISPWVFEYKGRERISFITCVGLKVTKDYYQNDLSLIKEKTGIDLDLIGQEKAAVLCKYYSDDDGQTWQKEFLTGTKTPLWHWNDGQSLVFLNTIGQVHKIPEGKYKGRLIVAAPMRFVSEKDSLTDNFRNHICNGSGIIYSDDEGESWNLGGRIIDYLGNEASAVSVNNGEELLMIRRLNKVEQYKKYFSDSIQLPGIYERIAHKSMDGGKSWSEPFFLPISDIQCHGTLANVKGRLYFSIPHGRKDRSKKMKYWDLDRVRGAIYFSDDQGKNWDYKIVEEEFFSYNTVGKLDDNHRITFFSRGGHGRYGIGCRIFTDDWLNKR